jgi:hypothetical protein
MARDRKGAQLSFELPPELFERLRAHAAAERRTMAALLRRWIEAGLAGALEPSAEPSAALVSLANRVETLEREVAQLQAGALRVPRRDRVAPPSPDRGIPAPPAGEAITTAELAERTGTNRAAWNNWAAADRIGQTRAHPQAGSWRLVGKAPAPGGGPERWLWEAA